ncbi:MAG: aminotransferase class V-fold PLP-dependent enzyme [Bacteroidota bacterium]
MNIEQLRLDTPGVAYCNHLNNAGAALPPRVVLDTMTDSLLQEARMGGYEFMSAQHEVANSFYTLAAQLLHAQERQIAYTTNATDAYNRALSAIPFERGDLILTTDDDYVSNQLAFLQLQKRYGVKIIRVATCPTGGVSVQQMTELIRQYHPKLVAVTHVPTNSGLIQEIEEIGRCCQMYDILYLVDACQSIGQMPLDVSTIHCDFLTATYRKWLRGPRGAGLLYVSDKVLRSTLAPHFIDLRGSTWVSKDKYVLEQSAKRFELWERSYALMLGARAATAYALDIGLDVIQKRVQLLAAYTRKQLQTIAGVRVLDRGARVCGIVTAHIAGIQPDALLSTISAQQINVSIAHVGSARIDFAKKQVDWALRISPHYYNTTTEIDQIISVIHELETLKK